MFNISFWNHGIPKGSPIFFIQSKIKSNFTFATSSIRALFISTNVYVCSGVCLTSVYALLTFGQGDILLLLLAYPCQHHYCGNCHCCLTMANAEHDRFCHFCCTGVFVIVVTIASLISSTTANSLLGWQQQCRRFSQRFSLLPFTCDGRRVSVWIESVFIFFLFRIFSCLITAWLMPFYIFTWTFAKMATACQECSTSKWQLAYGINLVESK